MRYEISKVIRQDQVMDLVYGNSCAPRQILGRHDTDDGQVIAAYHPDAARVEMVLDDGRILEMDSIERQPVFAVFLPDKKHFHYRLRMTFPDGNTFNTEDPYSFPSQITKSEEILFLNGQWTDAFEKLGCHRMTIDGVPGMYFAVWAPSARRVSIVGDFNFWNGMIYPMNRLEESGIFELFLPELTDDHTYKFEVKTWQGEVTQKADPFGRMDEEGGGNASKILDINEFHWDDGDWMQSRRYRQKEEHPIAVCNVGKGDGIREDLLREGCFTHLLFTRRLSPDALEQDEENVHKYLYQPPFFGGSADRFRSMINAAHKNGISVLMEISLGYYGGNDPEYQYFDGSGLFGYSDSRIGFDDTRKKWRFCFTKPEVVSLVLSSLIFWIRRYHIDGFIFEGISDLILPRIDISNKFDIGFIREVGQLPHDNIRFLKMAVSAVRQEDMSILLIADERPKKRCIKGTLFSLFHGFDYYVDYDVRENISSYFRLKKKERRREHFRLTLPLQKQELESSLQLLNPFGNNLARDLQQRQELLDSSGGLRYHKRLAEMRMTAAYLLGVPGRKIWTWTDYTPESRAFIRRLFEIYRHYPALYGDNEEDTSFEWINCVDAVSSVVSFIRKSEKKKSVLIFICNFSGRTYEKWQTGVFGTGRYRLILNTDDSSYGGKGRFTFQEVMSMRQRCDFRPCSIQVSLPPYATLVFEYTPM